MMKPDDIEQWAWDRAELVGERVYGRHDHGFVMWPLVDNALLKDSIARALLDAERRGMETAAVIADEIGAEFFQLAGEARKIAIREERAAICAGARKSARSIRAKADEVKP